MSETLEAILPLTTISFGVVGSPLAYVPTVTAIGLLVAPTATVGIVPLKGVAVVAPLGEFATHVPPVNGTAPVLATVNSYSYTPSALLSQPSVPWKSTVIVVFPPPPPLGETTSDPTLKPVALDVVMPPPQAFVASTEMANVPFSVGVPETATSTSTPF